METGEQGNYFWLEDASLFIGDLLAVAPEIVVGEYLVVTSFDSGPLELGDEQFQQGWMQHDDLAINPSVLNTSDIPFDEYDEWYLFRTAPLLEGFEVFVNYGSFCLQDPEQLFAKSPSTDVVGTRYLVDVVRDMQERFWNQLELKAVESYVAGGSRLTVATKKANMHKVLVTRLAPLSLARRKRESERTGVTE